MRTALTASFCTVLALTLVACKNDIFHSEPLGHGPDEYEIYTPRRGVAAHEGEGTVRAGVMILPPMQPLVRPPARQKEVLTALSQFYEKLYALDERRAKDSVTWLTKFLTDHRGLAPDQPVAIQSALDSMVRAKERANKRIEEAPNEPTKENIREAIKKIDEEIAFFQKYTEERPAKAAEYQAHMDGIDAANKRMQTWQARHTRMTNTGEWVKTTSGSADAEINRAMREMADLLNHEDDQTRLETIAMAANLGGSDAKQLLPRIKAVAADTKASAEVRAFAAKASESIESQGG